MKNNVSKNKILNSISTIKLLIKLCRNSSPQSINKYIDQIYSLKTPLPKEFYEKLSVKIKEKDYKTLYKVLKQKNIYYLIDYVKSNNQRSKKTFNMVNPTQYYEIPEKQINLIVKKLKKLKISDESIELKSLLKKEPQWQLKRNPTLSNEEYKSIAYKMYLSIGFTNAIDVLEEKYGTIDYEEIYYLFSKLNVKKQEIPENNQYFRNFFFGNKKDPNNAMKQALNGNFLDLFLNFDYFYNNFSYFLNKLGNKLPRDKVRLLIKERYLSANPTIPKITGDISDDFLSSYYWKYETLDTPVKEVNARNYQAYESYLQNKRTSSIPRIQFTTEDGLECEILKLDDPRTLTIGYRAGNCFRINGQASTLFHTFLQSEHMRLLSISTPEYKDYAMMLIMRNGNVLIGQGIETSNRVPENIKGKPLYEACRKVMKNLMEQMNSSDDEIVATIIGRTNTNVSNYNDQILPFLISPILNNGNNYYNGIDNYQCLLDLKQNKSLNDIKLFTPTCRYLDEREPILTRTKDDDITENKYREIEQRLIGLRYRRLQKNQDPSFYQILTAHTEESTSCNRDWYVTLYTDGTIDSFLADTTDERAKTEYNEELHKVHQKVKKI